jgi:DNA-binding SARP family transcriptional activator
LADFDEVWIDPRRERYRRRFLEIGGQLTEEALRVGDLGEAQEVAERLVSCDPLSEAAHHLLVRAYAAAGRHDAATRQRERCRALQKQFGAGDGRDLE